MNVKLKSIVGKLNDTCRKSLEAAAGLTVSRTNYDVEIEHWLFKLNEIPNTDFQRVLRYFEIKQEHLSRDLSRILDRLKTGNTRNPALSPYIVRWLNGTWLFASIDFDSNQIRSSHLLLALLADDELVQMPEIRSTELKKIDVDVLHGKLLEIVKGSDEDIVNSEKPTPSEVET
jgi:type VI secretion system protein VasG